jgi:hypothetical protein
MPIAKRDIVEMLLVRGDHQRAIRADDELPELVYADLHGRLLWDLGLEPAQLERDLAHTGRRFAHRPLQRRSFAGRS